jgi:hypothetical protein
MFPIQPLSRLAEENMKMSRDDRLSQPQNVQRVSCFSQNLNKETCGRIYSYIQVVVALPPIQHCSISGNQSLSVILAQVITHQL